MKKPLQFLFIIIVYAFTLISCKKNCTCDLVVYEKTFETSGEWVEKSRERTDQCERDTMSSVFLDENGNISYVRTIIECSK